MEGLNQEARQRLDQRAMDESPTTAMQHEVNMRQLNLGDELNYLEVVRNNPVLASLRTDAMLAKDALNANRVLQLRARGYKGNATAQQGEK